jgi:hypothetical protein
MTTNGRDFPRGKEKIGLKVKFKVPGSEPFFPVFEL